MKILLLSDRQGWVVDRITQEIAKRLPFDVKTDYYTTVKPDELLSMDKAGAWDIIHFGNSDQQRFLSVLPQMKTPMIMSIRSFRYPPGTQEVAAFMKRVHVIHPDLVHYFENAIYIPDAVDDLFQPTPFTVGMAYQPMPWNLDYKGVYLVEEACEQLGVKFKPAVNLKPEEMPDYYKSIDLYVCASLNEGFGAPVMECLMLNKPVITTDVGAAHLLNVTKIERTVESIKEGILKFYTYPQVKDFRWDVVCKQMTKMYQEVYDSTRN